MKQLLTMAALAALIVSPVLAQSMRSPSDRAAAAPVVAPPAVQPNLPRDGQSAELNTGAAGLEPGLLPSQIGTSTPRGDAGPAVAPSSQEPPVPPFTSPGGG